MRTSPGKFSFYAKSPSHLSRSCNSGVAYRGMLRRFPVLIWIEHPLADYYVCEQDSCGGESGYAHSMSPVPNPMYPPPISSTFRHATSEWNQDKD
jgi:hypothetical protein